MKKLKHMKRIYDFNIHVFGVGESAEEAMEDLTKDFSTIPFVDVLKAELQKQKNGKEEC